VSTACCWCSRFVPLTMWIPSTRASRGQTLAWTSACSPSPQATGPPLAPRRQPAVARAARASSTSSASVTIPRGWICFYYSAFAVHFKHAFVYILKHIFAKNGLILFCDVSIKCSEKPIPSSVVSVFHRKGFTIVERIFESDIGFRPRNSPWCSGDEYEARICNTDVSRTGSISLKLLFLT